MHLGGGVHTFGCVMKGRGHLRNVTSYEKSKWITEKSAGDRLQNEVEIIFFSSNFTGNPNPEKNIFLKYKPYLMYPIYMCKIAENTYVFKRKTKIKSVYLVYASQMLA